MLTRGGLKTPLSHYAPQPCSRLHQRLAVPVIWRRTANSGTFTTCASSSSSSSSGGGGSSSGYSSSSSSSSSRRGSHGQPSYSRKGKMDPAQLTLDIKATTSLGELEQLVVQHKPTFNHIHLSAAFTQLAQNHTTWDSKQRSNTSQLDGLLRQLSSLLPQVLPDCGARGAANMLHSLGTLQRGDAIMVAACLHRFHSDISNATPQNIANVVWALAKLAESGQPAAQHAVQAALQHSPDALAACIRHFGSDLTDTPQGLANVIWALAKLHHLPGDQRQLQQLLQALADRAAAAHPQALSNALWAVSALQLVKGWQPGSVEQHTVQQLVVGFVGKLADANSQHISNFMLALARLANGSDHAAMLVSNDVACKCGLAAVRSACAKPLDGQGIGNNAWACGELGVYDEASFAALDRAAQQVLQDLEPQELSNLAWAAAKLGYVRAPQLVALLIGEAARRLEVQALASDAAGFTHQGLATLCWACAVAAANLPLAEQSQLAPQLRVLCATLSQHWEQQLQGKQSQGEDKRQLAQLHIWLHDTHQPNMLPDLQLQHCKDAWRDQLQKAKNISGLQHEVFRALKQLQHNSALDLRVTAQQEVCTADGMFSIDITAEFDGQQIAIEVDGPSHFTYPANRVKGDTVFRNRALAARGYIVVSIPAHEWDRLRTDARLAYLTHRLQGVLAAQKPQTVDVTPTVASSNAGSNSNSSNVPSSKGSRQQSGSSSSSSSGGNSSDGSSSSSMDRPGSTGQYNVKQSPYLLKPPRRPPGT